MKKGIYSLALSVYLVLLIVYWAVLRFQGLTDSFYNYFYSFLFSLVPLVGGLLVVNLSRKWGHIKSFLGRALFFFGFGLFSWGAGSMVWSYYNFFADVAAPYPSLADIGFIVSLPCWAVAIVYLAKTAGAKFGLKTRLGKVTLFLGLPLVILISYYLLVVIARDGMLLQSTEDQYKLFFDLAYPLGDVIILSFAAATVGLSYNFFGGIYKKAYYIIILGLATMYLADFVFSYTTTIGTFYVGNFGDLLFTLALFLMTYGCLGFNNSEKV